MGGLCGFCSVVTLIMSQSSITYSVFTPFFIPRGREKRKRVNIGDGFILDAVRNLIGSAAKPAMILSNRKVPTEEEIEAINGTDFLVLAGANQLDDSFVLWPGMDWRDVDRIKVPIYPFGIGLNGEKGRNEGLRPEAVKLLEAVHERIGASSWRCPKTVRYLEKNLPTLRGKFIMTGCPVQYQWPILGGGPFRSPSSEGKVVVTVTERGKFWERETATIDYVAGTFPRARKFLVLHQDFRGLPVPRWKARDFFGKNKKQPTAEALHTYAEEKSFEIFHSGTTEGFYKFFSDVDVHFGSRLHAHLYLMGQNTTSYLTYVDDRCSGFSEHFDFPIWKPSEFVSHDGYNFEHYRSRLLETWPVMRGFLDGVTRLS